MIHGFECCIFNQTSSENSLVNNFVIVFPLQSTCIIGSSLYFFHDCAFSIQFNMFHCLHLMKCEINIINNFFSVSRNNQYQQIINLSHLNSIRITYSKWKSTPADKMLNVFNESTCECRFH